MMLFRALLLTLVGYTVAQTVPELSDRQCPCTLNSLWVDVAVAIDTSTGMGFNGLTQVLADLGTVFIQSQVGQQKGQYTKVGVVTYDKTATVQFNMTHFTSTNQFEQDIWDILGLPMTKTESIIKSGIAAAAKLLETVKTKNRKQAIMVYASDYKGDGEDDPTELAKSLEESGICLITIAFNQGEGAVIKGLKNLACKGMFVSSSDADPVGHIQKSLCQRQIASAWTPAHYACQNLAGGGYLATAATPEKIAYMKNMSLADITFENMPHEFLVGLKYNSGAWFWDQGAVYPSAQADQYVPWLSGYPIDQNLFQCGLVSPAAVSERSAFGLKNINCNTVAKRYTCQVNSCDTDIYCP